MATKHVERDFEDDVKINKYKLDREAAEHPSIYLYWSRKKAHAIRVHEDAVDVVKEIRSTVDLDIRRRAEAADDVKKEFGVAKLTEATIASLIDVDPRMIEARKERAKALEDLELADAAVRALEHRRTSLSNLTDLWGKQYYSEPNGRRDSATDAAGRDVRRNLNEGRKGSDDDEEE